MTSPIASSSSSSARLKCKHDLPMSNFFPALANACFNATNCLEFAYAPIIERAEALVRREAHVAERLAVGSLGKTTERHFPRDRAPVHRFLIALRHVLVDHVAH